jgi:hypothetical protein
MTIGCATAGPQAHLHHTPLTVQPSPLHLHPPESVGDVEREVDATVVSDRQQDSHAGLDRGEHDCLLGDIALDVGVVVHANTCSWSPGMGRLHRPSNVTIL